MDRSELDRLKKLCSFESKARKQGHQVVAGIDEAGRGPLAGPVFAAACIIPKGVYVAGVNDSKKLSPKYRQDVYQSIVSDHRITFAVASVDEATIDQVNIFQATIQAMLLAVGCLAICPDYLLVDGLKLPHPTIPSEKIISGDSLSQSIAAASVIAKVQRDQLMEQYHERWPVYGFNEHKGYGTEKHRKAIEKYGICPGHRKSFAPCCKAFTLV